MCDDYNSDGHIHILDKQVNAQCISKDAFALMTENFTQEIKKKKKNCDHSHDS